MKLLLCITILLTHIVSRKSTLQDQKSISKMKKMRTLNTKKTSSDSGDYYIFDGIWGDWSGN